MIKLIQLIKLKNGGNDYFQSTSNNKEDIDTDELNDFMLDYLENKFDIFLEYLNKIIIIQQNKKLFFIYI